ncbi:MAG: thiamine phosphate synthase [Muribaculaceae bacterium]|nr:thiamine phosphate synthase [Muribaculaceae bacterium]
MLQFITDSKAQTPVAEQIKQFINGGGRWVQISMPEATDEEISAVVSEIKQLCIDTETFLLLNDHAELAKTLDVGGVYLEKGDMLPSKARMLLGPAAVIGVKAQNIDEIKAVRSLDIDFIALTPFRADNAVY